MHIKFFQTTSLIFLTGAAALSFPALATSDRFYTSVQKQFYSDYSNNCDSIIRDNSNLVKPEVFELQFNYSYEEADAPKNKFTLYVFPCSDGPFNSGSVLYGFEEGAQEVNQLHFAEPEYDIDFTDDTFEKVLDIRLRGFSTTNTLFNLKVDPENNTIFSITKWRRIADASASGLWKFESGRFVLKSFDVDATYDDQINPKRIWGEEEPPISKFAVGD
ncbi:MAG: hypothetical protein L3J21_10215 [Devosiaceae bacterium]|nr:hypothetical protein [Devosiaceae bacterium]